MSLPSDSNTTRTRACTHMRGHALAATTLFAFALSSSALAQVNRLECWGRNVEGQCTVPSSLGPVSAAAGGVYHTLALRPDGSVAAWGINAEGQTSVPAGLGTVIGIAAGSYHNAVVKADGTVVCWGRNIEGQCTVPAGINTVTAVSAGWKHTLALRANGSVAAWGAAGSAQVTIPAGLGVVTRISAGSQHNMALLSDGTVRCWGAGTTNAGVSPNFGQSIVPAGLTGVTAISAGANHSVALKSDGTVVCWGQTAFGISTPPAGLSGVVAIAAGNAHTMALKADRSIVGWGSNSSGQLTLPANLRVPTAIFAGGSHSGAITVNAPSAVLVSAVDSVCHQATGSIDVTVNDATATSWTGPNGFASSSADLSGLAAGSYTLTATGAGGVATLQVTVGTLPDTQAPAIASYTQLLTVDARQDCTALVPNFVPSVVASDNCSATGALVITQTPAAGTVAQLGDSVVSIVVRDESGNSSTVVATARVAGTASTNYQDADGDGFGNPATAGTYCILPVGFVTDGTDCNDAAAAVHPGMVETCNDIDDDCVGGVDDGLTFQNYFVDADGDNYGAGTATSSCRPISGSVTIDGDCNDGAAAIHPGVVETCNDIDDDCVGGVDDGLAFQNYFVDADGDNFGAGTATNSCRPILGSVTTDGDCNDGAAAIHPGVIETCNDLDDDCVGGVDDGLAFQNYFVDADGDNFGAGTATSSCRPISGSVTTDGDCNDGAAAIHPGVVETCNDIDDDCVGGVDDGLVFQNYFVDADGDGFGAGQPTNSCRPISGSVTTDGDCNDGAAAIHPGVVETCNDIDDDCVGGVDDGLVFQNYFVDADGDGFGAGQPTNSCRPISGSVTTDGDCNDGAAAIHPGVVETCNDIDDDCVGGVDDGLAFQNYFVDTDNDGFGAGQPTNSCRPISGSVTTDGDCNDGAAAIHPNAVELCNDIDDDCDQQADEGIPTNDYFRDLDADGYGNAAALVRDCASVPPTGYVTDATDCNDGAAGIHPTADERCADLAIDNDCDGSTAEAEAIDRTRFYADVDDDGAGDPATSLLSCAMPQGFVENANDQCPANGALVATVTYFRDFDQDEFGSASVTVAICELKAPAGYVTNSSDCNDAALLFVDADGDGHGSGELSPCGVPTSDDECPNTAARIAPIDWYGDSDNDGAGDASVAVSACDAPVGFVGNTSDLCPANGSLQSPVVYFIDGDADGFGVGTTTTSVCETTAPSGYSAVATDCNDAVASTRPGAPELCNETDDDCDAVVDEDLTFTTYYRDADGDTFGALAVTESTCTGSPTTGFVSDATDCDDARASVHAMASFHIDADQDGFGIATPASLCEIAPPAGYSVNALDCNDSAAAVNPAASEVCDAADIDENCSGTADDRDASVVEASKADFFADADADGYSVAAATRFCDIKPGFLAARSAEIDCVDTNAAINPGVAELCNGIDDNCSGAADDGLTFTTYYRDADGDTYGDPATTESNCLGAPSTGFIRAAEDCNDHDASANPVGIELCSNLAVDNDCDGSVLESEATDRITIYADVDGDGAGDAAGSMLSCTVIDGFSANSDDQCPSNRDLISTTTYFVDADGDQVGDSSLPVQSCESSAPAGYAATGGDGCPTDALKIAPGACGCGNLDTDSDSDGTADCNDGCPNDAHKIAPGTCGCGVADTDSDGDGTSNCLDLCPNDPHKTAPGTCGCGVADTDTDGDGTSDCASFMLSLDPAANSVRGGQLLSVRVSSSWPSVGAPTRAISLQLAVRFDHTRLQLVGVDNTIAGAPFTLELARVVGVDTDPASTDALKGTLLYAAGLNPFADPADAGMTEAAPLVDLVFEVLPGTTDCGIEDLVRVVPSLGTAPVRTRLTTQETSGSDGVRVPTLLAMIPVALDFDGPVLSGVPSLVSLPTDAGSAIGAVVAQPTVTADDACNGTVAPTLLVTYPNGSTSTTWPAEFPNQGSGVSLATWTAVDAAGNSTSATMRIEVANYQRLDATIVLQGSFNAASNRAIRIAGPAFSQTFAVPMAGVNGQISDIHVPVSTSYSCLAAKDLAHSLTTTTSAAIVNRGYQATFVLRQGDSNDDDSVDIYDFSLFAADRGLASGAAGRSNFNSDIAVNNADFAFISTNFFRTGDSCSSNAQGREAVTRVSVKELRRRGLGHLEVADMNRDGWVDLRDVQQFMQGNGISPESADALPGGNG